MFKEETDIHQISLVVSRTQEVQTEYKYSLTKYSNILPIFTIYIYFTIVNLKRSCVILKKIDVYCLMSGSIHILLVMFCAIDVAPTK